MIAVLHVTLAEPPDAAPIIVERHSPTWYGVTIGDYGVQVLGEPAALLATLQAAAAQVEAMIGKET